MNKSLKKNKLILKQNLNRTLNWDVNDDDFI